MTAHRLILCEGYSDRAFLKGWLKRLGCTDLGKGARGGQLKGFLFRAPDAGLVEVAPMNVGIPAMYERIAEALGPLAGKFSRALVIFDHDGPAEISVEKRAEERTSTLFTKFVATRLGDSRLRIGSAELEVGVWFAETSTRRPMLERIIEVGLTQTPADAARMADVVAFADQKNPMGSEPALAFCGLWVPDRFGDAFFEHVWDDDHRADQLMKLLDMSGLTTKVRWLWS
jgi:hypothetical protein